MRVVKKSSNTNQWREGAELPTWSVRGTNSIKYGKLFCNKLHTTECNENCRFRTTLINEGTRPI